MPNVQDVLQALERIAPPRFAYDFDKIGLQVGDLGMSVKRGVVTFDRSLASVEFAAAAGAEVVVAHHPLIWNPLSTLDTRSHVGRTVLALAKGDIAFVAAHTNWDAAPGGINDTLATLLGLSDVRSFGSGSDVESFKVVVTCPADDERSVIDAASAAGAGIIGAYRRCAFSASGTGTFEPQAGATPTIGSVGNRESVEEWRVEMTVPALARRPVDRAIRKAHSYEEPAIDWYPLASRQEQPIGRVGSVTEISLARFVEDVEKRLRTQCWAWGDPERAIRCVAVVGGAADDEWRDARNAGADVLVTGEVKQHVALEAVESGFSVIAAGHYATEHPGCAALRERLAANLPEIDWLLFEPQPGQAGRPL